MARRMNEDLSCDHAAAEADLGFHPRPFDPRGDTLAEAEGRVETRPDLRWDDR
jgi:hypothetical protein